MSVSTSRLAYADCQEVFDVTLEDQLGIRIPFDTLGAATNFRLRLHKFRQIDREDNAHTFEHGHPLCGRSNYDVIRCRIMSINRQWYLYCEPIMDARHLKIERLAEVGLPPPRTVEIEQFAHQREILYRALQVTPDPAFEEKMHAKYAARVPQPTQKMRRS